MGVCVAGGERQRECVCCVLMCCPLLNATVISHRVKGSACTVRQKDAGMDGNVKREKDGKIGRCGGSSRVDGWISSEEGG